MQKEFIPYEQSLALKELGFDEPCFYPFQYLAADPNTIDRSYADYKNWNKNNKLISAPLYQQAFRWFREKYELAHNIHPMTYDCYVVNQKNPSIDDIGDFNTYEEAELACLKKLIEIIKQNK